MPRAFEGKNYVLRPTVRVVLLGGDDRTLLFSSVDDAGTFWYPPGGACEDGEDIEQTALRELLEETGFTDVRLEGEIGTRQGYASWGGVDYDCRERWLLGRTLSSEVDTIGFTNAEKQTVVRHRWWTVPELATTDDRLVPVHFAQILADLLRDGVPAEPLDLTPPGQVPGE